MFSTKLEVRRKIVSGREDLREMGEWGIEEVSERKQMSWVGFNLSLATLPLRDCL